MELVPTNQEVVQVLRDTHALRDGHFEYANGLHSDEYLQVPLALRTYQTARMLSVGLSRKLRSNPEIRANVAHFSIVAPAPNGLPVAYGICEALRANQVYWAEREGPGSAMRFNEDLAPQPGEQIILVDDILRSGAKLTEMKRMIEARRAVVQAVAVVIYQPTPSTPDFGPNFYYLARLEASYYADAASCALCRKGIPLEKVKT